MVWRDCTRQCKICPFWARKGSGDETVDQHSALKYERIAELLKCVSEASGRFTGKINYGLHWFAQLDWFLTVELTNRRWHQNNF